MAQNAPNTNAISQTARPRPVSARIARALAWSGCAFVLLTPLAGPGALAQGWQVTGQHYPGGWTETYRRLGPDTGGVTELKDGSAPGNRCPIIAFEVLNPGPGEPRCVGFVLPY